MPKSFRYMANSNLCLPLFDPTVDTFDAIRKRSTFCFTAILAISLRASISHPDPQLQAERAFHEAQKLAVESLFASSAKLETVQGMLILAAFSDKNWFAIRHACNMGRDLGMLDLLSPEPENKGPEFAARIQSDIGRVRLMRTALVLHHVEQEVASGTARQHEWPMIQSQILQSYVQSTQNNIHDVRIAATVEVVQLRGWSVIILSSSIRYLTQYRPTSGGHQKPT